MQEILFENVSYQYPESDTFILKNFNLKLPKGVVSLVGQNGTGKSTLLLLAGGTLLPAEGKVFIRGVDTNDLRDEHQRQEYISFVYQNMEFDTDESIEYLLHYVYEHGFHTNKQTIFIKELCEIFELQKVLSKKTQEISKGELQRTILAFSLLYGSRILLLDEPVFALESKQKDNTMKFLYNYAKENSISIYYSAHELELSEKYSDYILLFHKEEDPELGKTKEIFTREKIEKAYEVPFVMLKKKEALFRENMKTRSEYQTPQ